LPGFALAGAQVAVREPGIMMVGMLLCNISVG